MMFKKSILYVLLCLGMFLNLGCLKDKSEVDISSKNWDEILKLASGTKVTFYGWGGDENINRWIDEVVAKDIKQKYNITLERVPMLPNEFLPKLLNEKQLGSEGVIDIVWINGENFFNAKNQGLLYGPFAYKLPNFNKYVDKNSSDVLYDFGYPVEGFEAPYGKAQLVLIGDTAKLDYLPKNHKELLEIAKKYPGKITYPDASDFTGSAFIRNIIYDVVGYEALKDIKPNKEDVKKAIKPALDFLVELKPYLWRQGKAYPSTLAQLDNMFSDGEVYITMNYTPYHVLTKINEGDFSKTAKAFIFNKGTISNTHFLAIPFNAPNKAGALVVINHLLSPSIQAQKYNPKTWGDLPVISSNLLNEEEKKLFENVNLGKEAIPQDVLVKHSIPEMRAELIPIIESLWREVVLADE
ncbi:ABC transporter substrate-binding protein [Thermobrachium celere]|uniref:ABC transporter, periplasmic substrate-binding protein YnjB n=1 Tax=Thermobrachium celere DSM 8682 TaxID=941824 RepID=R7RRE2_9CLOT|nr:ABC transporter substrate-binding protein [Thermobrachium celere]CDF58609.1 ABC transporter, periplasmic substrate-binding protein YnjB [Thermobrachium celere DSM 8682]